MAVVIDELVTESAQEGNRSLPDATTGAPSAGGDGQLDIAGFDSEMGRRLHRAARLWAD